MKETELITPRIQLRLIQITDISFIHELHSLPETDTYNTLGIPNNIEETKTVISPWISAHQLPNIQNYTFIVVDRINGNNIGLLGFNLGSEKYKKGEIWYKIHSKFWKKGYATEAVQCAITFGFKDLGLHRIEAGCAIENTGSIKVLEKVGMIREGRKRQVLPLVSGWSDNYMYAILESDL